MKGNEKVIDGLNSALAEEMTALNQYMVHSEMYKNWGYQELHEHVEHQAIEEMKHAEDLMARILFLEGRPIVSNMEELHIGSNVEEMMENDRALEEHAIGMYNDLLKTCREAKDYGSHALAESILKDEEAHIDWQESQQDLMEQMGVQNYLAKKIEK